MFSLKLFAGCVLIYFTSISYIAFKHKREVAQLNQDKTELQDALNKMQDKLNQCEVQKEVVKIDIKKAHIKTDRRLLESTHADQLPHTLNQFLECETKNFTNFEIKC